MTLEPSRIQAICFDVDGTLSDTDDQFVVRLIRLLSRLRLFIPGRDIPVLAREIVMHTEGPGNWLYSLADRIGLDGEVIAAGDRLYQMGIGKSEHPFLLFTGVREMLAELSPHFPLSIVSARGQKSTMRFLSQFDLGHYFTVVVTGQTCRHTKPYPDPLLWAAECMGVPPSACVMVGDTEVDVRCGKRAGAQTVSVLWGFGELKELERTGPDLILEKTTDLPGVLLGKASKFHFDKVNRANL